MSDSRVGIVAEDESDCETIAVLIRRVVAETRGRPIGIRKKAARGCSNLIKRASVWMSQLAGDGCGRIVLVHDRDREDESLLSARLSALPVPRGSSRLVCIPVQEIEAWFFASGTVLTMIAGEPRQPDASPHLVADPKEKLIRLSIGANRRPRYSPNENPRYAEILELDECARRCRAFARLRAFITGA